MTAISFNNALNQYYTVGAFRITTDKKGANGFPEVKEKRPSLAIGETTTVSFSTPYKVDIGSELDNITGLPLMSVLVIETIESKEPHTQRETKGCILYKVTARLT